MPERNRQNMPFLGPAVLISLAFILGMVPPAHAYIGPAVVFFSYLLGPVAAIVLGVLMVIAFPFMRLYKKSRRKEKAAKEDESAKRSASEE